MKRLSIGNRFNHFTGLKTTGADIDAANPSIGKENLHPLKVGIEAAAGNSGNLFTNTAGLFCKTSPGDGSAYNRFFITNRTMLHRAGIIRMRCNLARSFFSYILPIL